MKSEEPATRAEQARERRALPLRGIILYGLAAFSTIAFIAITERVLGGHADAFDEAMSLAIHRADHDVVDVIMIAFTTIGSAPCLWGAIALVGFLAMRKHRWRFAVILAMNGVIALVVNTLLKLRFERARPALFDEITRPETYSFPSGHAMSAMEIYGALATVLIALYPRYRWPIVAIAAFLITNICLSRVYLGVHWITDVIGGVLSALPFFVVTVHMVHRIEHAQR